MTKSATRVAADKVTFTQAEVTAKDTAARAGRKNLIINGAMQVNQRGATSGITSGYFVDRFTLSACSASAVLTSSTPTEFPTAISVSATSGNPIIFQKIESKSCQGLSGKTVTVSFYAKNISNATTLYVKLQYAGSADSWGSSTTISEQNLGSLTSGWVKYTASWTVPAGGLNGLSLGILCAGTGTFTMGVTGVQLEVGSVATDFEHRSYGEILADCQRYFYNPLYNLGGSRGQFTLDYLVSSGNNGWITWIVPFPVSMRANSTFSHSLTPAKFLGSAAPADGADNFSFYIQNQGYAGLVGNGSIANLGGGGQYHGIVGTYYCSPSSTSASHIFIGNGCTFQFSAEL